MSWHFLHLGKLVDEDGEIRERAEHRFIARSDGFPMSIANVLGRRDPVRSLRKIDWKFGAQTRRAAFVQTKMRIGGVNHTLRVIDHSAHEGQSGRGREYVKRTYLLQPETDWQPQDAALPASLIRDPPAFEEVSTVPPWTPTARVPSGRIEGTDLEKALEKTFVCSGTMNDRRIRRINNILARMEPSQAAALRIDLSAEPEPAHIRWME